MFSAGIATADAFRRIAISPEVCPYFPRKRQRFQPGPFSGERPFAPTRELHNRLTLSSRSAPVRDLPSKNRFSLVAERSEEPSFGQTHAQILARSMPG